MSDNPSIESLRDDLRYLGDQARCSPPGCEVEMGNLKDALTELEWLREEHRKVRTECGIWMLRYEKEEALAQELGDDLDHAIVANKIGNDRITALEATIARQSAALRELMEASAQAYFYIKDLPEDVNRNSHPESGAMVRFKVSEALAACREAMGEKKVGSDTRLAPLEREEAEERAAK